MIQNVRIGNYLVWLLKVLQILCCFFFSEKVHSQKFALLVGGGNHYARASSSSQIGKICWEFNNYIRLNGSTCAIL